MLSDREIWMEIERGRLIFDPAINPEQVGPSSVDLRISDTLLSLKPPGGSGMREEIIVRNLRASALLNEYADPMESVGGEFKIHPNELVLAYTLERVVLPPYLAARVEGKSSLARIGLSVHITAPTVQAGYQGRLMLEMLNFGKYPIVVTPGDRLCQLVLEKVSSPPDIPYRGQFQEPG